MGRTSTRSMLTNVSLDEISFVGKGDNPEAHVLLLKIKKEEGLVGLGKEYKGTKEQDEALTKWFEANPNMVKKEDGGAETFAEIMGERELRDKVWGMCYTLEESISTIVNDDTVTDKTAMITQSIEQFKAAITAITKGGTNIMPEKLKKELEEAGVKVAGLEKQVSDLTAENEVLKKAPTEGETCKTCGAKMVKKEDDILKGLPEAVQKEMKENREAIAKMQDDNLTREYIGKAANVALIGKSEDVGSLLKSIAKHDPKLAEDVLVMFKTADARIKEGDLLKEKGVDGGGTTNTALNKLNKLAEEYKKAHSEVSLEKAFSIVYKDSANAELRKEYQEESK